MRFRLRTIFVVVTLVALILCLCIYWDAIPGTFYTDNNGFTHGTGQWEHFYDDGSLMIREHYFRGLIFESTWFKPDGTELATETYDKTSGGVGYYLRQDGSIKSKYTYEYSPADNLYIGAGQPVYYDRNSVPVSEAMEPIQ